MGMIEHGCADLLTDPSVVFCDAVEELGLGDNKA